LALTLGGILGVAIMGLLLGPVVRRLEAERNTYRERLDLALQRAEFYEGALDRTAAAQKASVPLSSLDIAREVIERERTLEKLPWLRKGGMSGSE
jgi:hypothetical protein